MNEPSFSGVSARFHAQSKASSRRPRKIDESKRISEIYASATFTKELQQEYLPRESYLRLQEVIKRSEQLDEDLSQSVSHGMKEWALKMGASHFCHWFQPQTGLTAEKHDSFLSFTREKRPLERFSGKQLFQGEPDASSFPSGGARSTFEARGYTMWDPTSPAFIVEAGGSKTLCIPSHFLSYDGQALDEKTPLTRSQQVLNRWAAQALELLTGKSSEVQATTGLEQEYFLVDRAFASLRPDILLSGRTLLGAQPAKGQELDDHYFGAIKERVLAFMEELDRDLMMLGVPVKTRHNEVAPMQFELAPIFREAHLATDHNQLVMARAKAIAQRHDFSCLLHEKPFAGLNGSGKHINWSIKTVEGENLLEPGDTPEENERFLFFLCAFLEGLKKRGSLLRASVATAGNDHRLGANEAPPAIMSVFLGSQLSSILDALAKGEKPRRSHSNGLDLGLDHLSTLPGDTTDRNRTSPIAFTGNKFEFRACGSSQSTGFPTAILNAAMAEGLSLLCEKLKAKLQQKKEKKQAMVELLQESALSSSSIRYDGNCYSLRWREEAKKRGLPELANTPAALAVLVQDEVKDFLSRFSVLNPSETEGRYRVRLEQYSKVLEIESACLQDMVRTQIIPALLYHQHSLFPQGGGDAPWSGYGKRMEGTIAGVVEALESLEAVERESRGDDDLQVHAQDLAEKVLPAMNELRKQCDEAEYLVADSLWPLPKYREMLFIL